jgi:undecaprenyl-diphosphatase
LRCPAFQADGDVTTYLAAALLGVVQGLTEFLPISSSGHLILARAFFGWESTFGRAFDVACHVGTAAAVIAFFRADLVGLARAVPEALSRTPGANGRRLQLIIAGTIPIVIVGGLWSDAVDHVRTPVVVAVMLFLGSGLLLLIERVGRQGAGEEQLTALGAIVIGVAQAAALVPGLSRSGATIAAGMALGLRREAAARFTFLMSVPAIVAAAAKEGLEMRGHVLGPQDAWLFLIGMVTSAIVGYLTVKYFLQFLVRHRLDVFAWYRIVLAAVTVVWLVTR